MASDEGMMAKFYLHSLYAKGEACPKAANYLEMEVSTSFSMEHCVGDGFTLYSNGNTSSSKI